MKLLIICPMCGKVVPAKAPRGGDGSALLPNKHGICQGRFYEVDASESFTQHMKAHDAETGTKDA